MGWFSLLGLRATLSTKQGIVDRDRQWEVGTVLHDFGILAFHRYSLVASFLLYTRKPKGFFAFVFVFLSSPNLTVKWGQRDGLAGKGTCH